MLKTLLQNRYFQIFLLSLYYAGIVQTGSGNKKVTILPVFRSSLLKIGRPRAKPADDIYNPIGL